MLSSEKFAIFPANRRHICMVLGGTSAIGIILTKWDGRVSVGISCKYTLGSMIAVRHWDEVQDSTVCVKMDTVFVLMNVNMYPHRAVIIDDRGD